MNKQIRYASEELLKQHYQDWLLHDTIELEAVICLVRGMDYNIRLVGMNEAEHKDYEKHGIAAARNFLGKKLQLIPTEFYVPVSWSGLEARAEDFLPWALEKNIIVPEFLKEEAEKFSEAVENSELQAKPQSKITNMREPQRRKERCRAIAGMKWAVEEKLVSEGKLHLAQVTTIETMADDRDIIMHGCEGKVYKDIKTIRSWIADLCPNRKPGRRPKT